MIVHPISAEHLRLHNCKPLHGFQLCIYESEPTDFWQGYVGGDAGWTNHAPLPSVPMESFEAALESWLVVLRVL